MKEVAAKGCGFDAIDFLQIFVPGFRQLGKGGRIGAYHGRAVVAAHPLTLRDDVLFVLRVVVRNKADVALQHRVQPQIAQATHDGASEFGLAFNESG